MLAPYHVQVTTEAPGAFFSERALAAILRANLQQDSLRNLLRKEIHFDDCLFAEGLAHIERLRGAAAVAAGHPAAMWQAFGALAHSAQDFYSHSNYCQLWMEARGGTDGLDPEAIDPLDPGLLVHPSLRSGSVSVPWDALYLLPGQSLILKLHPPRPDSHHALHLDDPSRGPAFPFSLVAARKRTVVEYEWTAAEFTARQFESFSGAASFQI
ncbi:MAG: hypothetical protein HY784_13550 [Chloroflexi bacterium]|nr:hypothetical protein [Chloroflexota bacterium]